jgi:hypothetical protein
MSSVQSHHHLILTLLLPLLKEKDAQAAEEI